MRQGNGTELLGLDDPRSATIGIIHVSPNDDRKSVLAAIITQEKLNRTQVAIVLPEDTKAFQRPQDFDDLKMVRRKLHTHIVFIGPEGPGPSVFAQQRGFLVYHSLEKYKQALLAEKEGKTGKSADNGTGRKGWLFGGLKQKGTGSTSPTPEAAKSTSARPQEAVSVVSAGAGMLVNSINGTSASTQNNGAGSTASSSVMRPDTDWEEFRPLPSPTPSTPNGHGHGDGQGSNGNGSNGSTGSTGSTGNGRGAGHTNGSSVAEPGIIELSPRHGRPTGKLPVAPIVPIAAIAPEPLATTSPPKRSSGKMPIVTAGSAAGGATMSRANSGGTPPPMRANASGGGGGGNRSARNWLIGIGLLLLTLLLTCAGLAYAQPGTLGAVSNILPGAKQQTATTVTITPDNHVVPNSSSPNQSYVITGVTSGTPDTAHNQIAARVITSTSPSQQKTVNATGVKQTPATQATGTLTFYNSQPFQQTVGSGTVFTLPGGVQIANNGPAVIPAAHLPTTGFVTVNAHAITTGTAGNIKALALNGTCCVAGVSVQNTIAFTGGQDPQNYTFVQQSDIDGAVSALQPAALQQAQSGLKLNANEKAASNPQCTPNVTSNQPAGAKATNVTVTVSATCKTEAYDQNQLQSVMTPLLQKEATRELGQGYVLAGGANGLVLKTTIQGVTDKAVSLLVTAQGRYFYQIDAAQKIAFAKLIAGLSVANARTKLKSQHGVGDVAFAGNITTLPSDYTQITIAVQDVSGLQGGSSGGGASMTPTVTGPGAPGPGTPTAVPGNGNNGGVLGGS